MPITEPRPGIAASSPPATRRMLGTTEMRRSTRSTRSARSTASGPVAGMSAMPTTTKSNTLHGSRKKLPRQTASRSPISTTNTASIAWSIVLTTAPHRAMIASLVSRPRVTALTRMSAITTVCVGGDSIQRASDPRQPGSASMAILILRHRPCGRLRPGAAGSRRWIPQESGKLCRASRGSGSCRNP